jgi:hypothetical protein
MIATALPVERRPLIGCTKDQIDGPSIFCGNQKPKIAILNLNPSVIISTDINLELEV